LSLQMPYMIISGGFNIDTKVGGKNADLPLMTELGATKGKLSQIFTTPLPAIEVLQRLELKGWKVISSAAVPSGEILWTLHKEAPSAPPMYNEKFG
ncbi:hypothetical protein PMAYCL1PPCAC_32837, partial [Pristionchus mayeri]